jgi:photosystem II stability/assembly factor-like uncharacterized protein
MSSGEGPNSRIYVTDDGGEHWTLSFANEEPLAFYDCMTFFDDRRGLVLSDPPDGVKFRILSTSDGGHSWRIVDPSGMPPALPGEFAFAAGGQCLTGDQGRRAWFGTGGGAQARVFGSNNRGETWTVRRSHGDRGRPHRQQRQHRLRDDVDRLRLRQPGHDRLREPDRVLGVGCERPRRLPDALRA